MATETRSAMETYKFTHALERKINAAMRAHFTAKAKGQADAAAAALVLEQALRAELHTINPLASYWSGSITASLVAKAHLAKVVDLRG